MTHQVPKTVADATLLAVHEHGLERLTYADVARHADVPVPEVTRLAESPAALAAAAMQQSYEDWRDQVPAWLPIPGGGSLAEGLTGILRETFRHLEDPSFLRLGHLLMLQPHPEEPADDDGPAPDPRATFLDFRARAEDEFTAWFRHAIDRDPTIGPQERGADRMCARLVLLAIDGFVIGHHLEGGDHDADSYRTMVVGVVVGGLRA
jgi:AcrR family transcriptional regulator